MRRPKFNLIKIARLLCYIGCVFSLLTLLSLHALQARAGEAALALGRELAGLSDLTHGGNTMLINGARLRYVRMTSDQPLGQVLERLESHCDAGAGPLARALDQARAQAQAEFDRQLPADPLRRGILSRQTDDGGVVLCLVENTEARHQTLKAAVDAFAKTSDLSQLGNVRYAYAERLDSGRTRVVMFWNEGPINLSKMFPSVGDAAGSDSTVLPRPEASRRMLSAAALGMPYAVRSYVSKQRALQVKGTYDRWMQDHDWRLGAEAKGTLTYFRPDGYQVFVSVLEQQGSTFVTLTEAGRNAGSIQGVEVSAR